MSQKIKINETCKNHFEIKTRKQEARGPHHFVNVLLLLHYNLPLKKKDVVLHLNKLESSSPKNALYSLVEIGLVVLESIFIPALFKESSGIIVVTPFCPSVHPKEKSVTGTPSTF